MLFDFPIAIAPAFYKLDLSDLPCLIGAFAMGPVPALFIQVVKILIKLLLKPTSTAFVGELAAFCFSTIYCMTAAVIYSHEKSKGRAIKAMVIASIAMVIAASVGNYFFIIPAYVKMYNISLETIISMGSAIFPIVKDKLSFVLCCVMPFNTVKAIIVDVLTLILYKRISPILK